MTDQLASLKETIAFERDSKEKWVKKFESEMQKRDLMKE